MQDNKQKLLSIDDTREQMDGAMKRVGNHLQYFFRTMAADKLLMCLIFTALIAIVAAVACYFIFGGSSGEEDQ